jgi:alpha-L-fucosidase 2
MFNRFSLSLGEKKNRYQTPDQLIQSSSFGNLNNDLVVQLLEAARYIAISSTGELPPSLVGIWGGTWRPEWAGDFTQNGNVQSALAAGLNTNFPEIIEAYANYMWSMMDDFRDNAKDLFGAPGIFVPSRTSDFGKTYHYGTWNPHLFWFSGGPWVAQIFYDYWLYTGNEQFLEERAIPFMLAAADFMEFILTRDEKGRLMVIPSYSPENGPLSETEQYLAINATMDIASLKQLMRNLLNLVDHGLLESEKAGTWKNILTGLPAYAIDSTGDLKEWIWPGVRNNNRHRHASHLYPLFYEPDPDFLNSPALRKAAETAIENRLIYRRGKKGAEMAFGLVQLGLAAAHINDVAHAYECVDWLCNSYWSPAFTAYHDPGRIFNVDICGGLPAVVTEMIIQSSADEIILLPALPDRWPEGEVKGVRTRCGVTVDLTWDEGKPVSAVLDAHRSTSFHLRYQDRSWEIKLTAGQKQNWTLN